MNVLEDLKQYYSYDPVDKYDAMMSPPNVDKTEDKKFDDWIIKHNLNQLDEQIIFALKAAWIAGTCAANISFYNRYELLPTKLLDENLRFKIRTLIEDLRKKELK